MSSQSSIVLFSKLPYTKKAKTRLRKTSSYKESIIEEIHTAFVADALLLLNKTTIPNRYCYWLREEQEDPRNQDLSITEPHLTHYNQKGETFSKRFQNALEEIRETHQGSIIIIGSDCPLISTKTIELTQAKLSEQNVVIGPAPRNGFYLLGIPKESPIPDMTECFQEGLERELVIKSFTKTPVFSLPTLSDIDTSEDLAGLTKILSDNEINNEHIPKNTSELIASLSPERRSV